VAQRLERFAVAVLLHIGLRDVLEGIIVFVVLIPAVVAEVGPRRLGHPFVSRRALATSTLSSSFPCLPSNEVTGLARFAG